MPNTSLDSGDYSDEQKQLPMIDTIRSWVGLPAEEYSQNVEYLIKRLDEIDAEADKSMTETLLGDNLKEYFANGMYAREIKIPQGVALISRIHMDAGISVLSEGTIAVMDRDGYKEVSAPCTYTSPEGTQRIGLTLTPCTWVSLFKADKQEGVDMLDIVTAATFEEYKRRKECQE
jgi:hypothetical protein